jgi:hypothetical protein
MQQNGTKPIAAPSSKPWAVFPCHWIRDGKCTCGKDCDSPGKHPLTANGLLDATTDEQQLAKWWKVNPQANLAVATGESSGLVVIDIDPDKGGWESLLELEEKHGRPPETVEVETGGGGLHLYYRYPDSVKIHSRNGWLPGVDVKADGGYVIAPPSNHVKGSYRWADGRRPCDVELAEIPAWLLELLPRKDEATDNAAANGKPATNGTANGSHTFTFTNGGASLLQRAQAYVAAADSASEGTRNETAFRLAGHVAALRDNGCRLDEGEIVALLATWNLRNSPPLSDGELRQCVASALVNGKPRDAKESNNQAAGDSHCEPAGEPLLSDFMPISQFVRQSHHVEYLVPFAVVAGQPGVISARTKSLKTTVAIDANISMATATPFLGFWEVPSPIKCGILSGESGAATIDETIRRVARSKGVIPEEIDGCFVSSKCPRLQSQNWLDEIRRVIDKHDLRSLTLDPTYMAIAGIKQNDLSSVAALLEPVSRIISDTGCTILMVHHNRKVSDMRYGCPTLEEITGSGFAEWARFWLLLNRRREWDDTTGQHWLWLVTGGSAGFGSRKWLDVREGKPTDAGGRVWEVEIVAAGEGESREKAERERQKKDQREAKVLDDQKAVVEVLRKCGGKSTKTELRTRTGFNSDRLGAALAALLDRGDIVPTTIEKGNKRQYEGFQFHE